VFIEETVAICGITKAELMHGAESEEDLLIISKALSDFEYIPMDESIWDEVGKLNYRLRKSGIAVPFQDAVLCALALRYDLPMAAYYASKRHDVPFIVTTDITDVRDILNAIKECNESKKNKITDNILNKMEKFYINNAPKKYVEDINNYISGRSFAIDKDGNYFKLLSTNNDNLTTSRKRGGHIFLGEYFIAKYMITAKEPNADIWMFLPRLRKSQLLRLNETNKKEWKLVWHDSNGRVVTLEDFEGIDEKHLRKLARLKNSLLKNGTPEKTSWNDELKYLIDGINNGKIYLRKGFVPKMDTSFVRKINNFS